MFRGNDWQLNFNAVVVVRKVNSESVIRFELLLFWRFVQDFKLAQRNQMRLQIMISNLHVAEHVVISHVLAVIEDLGA